MNIPFLGAVPLDPRIGVACDYGESFFDAYPESPACEGLMGIIHRLREQMGLPPLEGYEEDVTVEGWMYVTQSVSLSLSIQLSFICIRGVSLIESHTAVHVAIMGF